jgi:hypothetical protein
MICVTMLFFGIFMPDKPFLELQQLQQLTVFATELLGPRINTCFVTLSRGLFLTWTGKNILIAQKACIQHSQQRLMHLWYKKLKTSYLG